MQLIYQQSDVPADAGCYTPQVPLPTVRSGPAVLYTPAEVGGYAQLRLFDASGQELIDQSRQITANNIANALWATELAAQINTQYSNLLQIGLLNGDNVEFSSDIAANRAYCTRKTTCHGWPVVCNQSDRAMLIISLTAVALTSAVAAPAKMPAPTQLTLYQSPKNAQL
ncbi:hypothetical protein [Rheinheimera lutimaris]|uniref:hypothetical protein n=1 Tax=Rheinheimera lutimaris TaxID=2740584 RepID=UPI0038B440C0